MKDYILPNDAPSGARPKEWARSQHITIRVTPSLKKTIKTYSEYNDISVTDFVYKALQEFMGPEF
jgi:predicted HicB family RNase H-like nuclease